MLDYDKYILDEGIELCGTCPSDIGRMFPKTYELMQKIFLKGGEDPDALASLNSLATFSCKHKITMRPICAIPCNGIADMCDDDEDEQCQGPSLVIILSSTTVLSILFISFAFLLDCFFLSQSQEELFEMDQIMITRENDSSSFKSTLSTYKYRLDFKSAVELSDKQYNSLKPLFNQRHLLM